MSLLYAVDPVLPCRGCDQQRPHTVTGDTARCRVCGDTQLPLDPDHDEHEHLERCGLCDQPAEDCDCLMRRGQLRRVQNVPTGGRL